MEDTGTSLIGETITTESLVALGTGELGGLPSCVWGGDIGGVSKTNWKIHRFFNVNISMKWKRT